MAIATKKGLARNGVILRYLLVVSFSLVLCELNGVQAARGFRHNLKHGKSSLSTFYQRLCVSALEAPLK